MLHLRFPFLLSLAILVAACGSSGPTGATATTPAGSGTPGAPGSESAAPASTAPGESPSAGPGESQPAESATPAATETPTSSAGASAAPGASDACLAGTNPTFFTDAAAAFAWPVLCATLPKGWFVSTGSYRQANGGKLLISYKGPAGATLALSEGAFCQDAGGCVPSGADAGDAALGSMAGTFVRLDSGDFAIVVDRGAAQSWLLVTHGLDEATTKALGTALVEVAG
jgi:hypothetical protein